MPESPRLLSRPFLLAALVLLVLSLRRGFLRKLRLVFLALVTVQTAALLVAVARAPTLAGIAGLALLATATVMAWRDLLRGSS